MWVVDLLEKVRTILVEAGWCAGDFRVPLCSLGHYCWPRGFGLPGSIHLQVWYVCGEDSRGPYEGLWIVEDMPWCQGRKWAITDDMFVRDRAVLERLCLAGAARDPLGD